MKKLLSSMLLVSVTSVICLPLQAADDKLVIVTSFPKDLTKVFKAEFMKDNPGIELEILKGTSINHLIPLLK